MHDMHVNNFSSRLLERVKFSHYTDYNKSAQTCLIDELEVYTIFLLRLLELINSASCGIVST